MANWLVSHWLAYLCRQYVPYIVRTRSVRTVAPKTVNTLRKVTEGGRQPEKLGGAVEISWGGGGIAESRKYKSIGETQNGTFLVSASASNNKVPLPPFIPYTAGIAELRAIRSELRIAKYTVPECAIIFRSSHVHISRL